MKFSVVWLSIERLSVKLELSDRTHESGLTVWLQYWPDIVEVVHPSTLTLALKVYDDPRLICNARSEMDLKCSEGKTHVSQIQTPRTPIEKEKK